MLVASGKNAVKGVRLVRRVRDVGLPVLFLANRRLRKTPGSQLLESGRLHGPAYGILCSNLLPSLPPRMAVPSSAHIRSQDRTGGLSPGRYHARDMDSRQQVF